MALQTDGEAVLNTNDVSRRDAEDVRRRRLVLPAELLLDQPEARWPLPPHSRRGEARRRPGSRAGPVTSRRPKRRRAPPASSIDRPGAKPAPPPTVTRALDALAPARGNLPVRVQAVGGRSSIRAIVELDRGHRQTAGMVVRRHAAAHVRAGAISRLELSRAVADADARRSSPASAASSSAAANSRWLRADMRSAPN